MKPSLKHLDEFREAHPLTGYTGKGDMGGTFRLPHPQERERRKFQAHFIVIASDGRDSGWDHVSVHARYREGVDLKMRTPMWEEMCWITRLFFDEDETVVEFHPAKSEYVNTHQHVLHLWKPVGAPIALPPTILV